MSEMKLADRSLFLERFPRTDEQAALQAWDAADEYLLQQALPDEGIILVVNDNFGALATALQPRSVCSYTDSWLSQQATLLNLRNNDYEPDSVTFIGSMEKITVTPAAVLIRIPKSLALLEYQLQQIRQVVTANTRIIAGAKTRDIHNSTLALFELYLGDTTTSLAVKKSRLIFSQVTQPEQPIKPQITSWQLEGTSWQIDHYANVFSRLSLDIGARIFMRYLPEGIEGQWVDLGCGNGVIGMQTLSRNPHAEVIFVDESWMAVASSERNVTQNLPEALPRCQFMVNHSLSGFTEGSLNGILCNPPFHQQHALTDQIAWQMFTDAKRCLAYGGELRVVGNRHLDYHRKLKRLFGNCQLLGSDSRFVVLRTVKIR